MSYAARAMRGLIIDYIRNRQTEKRGELFVITSLSNKTPENPTAERELPRISQALDELAKVEPGWAEIVDLKFFCGFSFAEIAATQHLSERTVQRRWEKARIYLRRELRTELESMTHLSPDQWRALRPYLDEALTLSQ